MNKELEALNDMLEYLLTYDEFNEKRHKHNASIIETALKRLKEIDKYLYINNKKLKALEIIKGIILNVYNWELVEDNGKYKILEDSGFIELEKEQYDLLKELL